MPVNIGEYTPGKYCNVVCIRDMMELGKIFLERTQMDIGTPKAA